MKHNKKRNTAFLYECLIKEMTKAIVRKDEPTKQTVVEILKNNFSKGSPLYNDLQQYKQLLETQNLSEEFATRFVTEVRKDWSELDRKEIFNCQTHLLKQINESISSDVFANFMPNYKNIATVGSYFYSKGSKPKTRLLIEDRVKTLVSSQARGLKNEEMKTLDSLTYDTFVNKFNETYQHTLRNEQRGLLTNYITSFSDNGLGLKIFMNEELGRLKNQIQVLSETKYGSKLLKVKEKLESFSKQPITETMVKDVFYIQDLVAEINKNES
tara:strand:- start:1826 stop:2635 length:810 start_codon:yes stop_codon:yes gene_type:complete